jgi:hypothetical protein
MKHSIDVYLDLTRHTNGLTAIEPHHVQTLEQKMVILGGIASPLDPAVVSAEQVVQEWQRMRAVPFAIELAITKGVYIQLRGRTENS